MLNTPLARICFRRLNRLPECRHTTITRIPRASFSITVGRNTAYQNPSFSPRPSNSIFTKIWYRKDGVPRTKWKAGAYLALLALLTYAAAQMAQQSSDFESVQDHLVGLAFLVRMLNSDIDFSSLDLSTPRSSLTHFRDIVGAGLEKDNSAILIKMCNFCLELLDAELLSPEVVEEIHKATREGCEGILVSLVHLRAGYEPVAALAVNISTSIRGGMELALKIGTSGIVQSLVSKHDKKIEKRNDSYNSVD